MHGGAYDTGIITRTSRINVEHFWHKLEIVCTIILDPPTFIHPGIQCSFKLPLRLIKMTF